MNNFIGFALTVIGGFSVGVNMWPLKWARRLKWENFWLIYAVVSLIIVPFALAFLSCRMWVKSTAKRPSLSLHVPS